MSRLPEDEIRHLPPQRQDQYRQLVSTTDSGDPQRAARAEQAVAQFIRDTAETRAQRRVEAEMAASRDRMEAQERLREIDSERQAIEAELAALKVKP